MSNLNEKGMSSKESRRQFIWYFCLVLASILVVLAFYYHNLFVFIISGLFLGIFYGWNNYRIFHYPHTDEFYQNYLTKEKQGFEKVPPVNTVARINTMWIHLVSCVTGSIALFFLSTRINPLCARESIERLNWVDGVLFAVVLLGYTGLLPRTLWFGNVFGFIKPK